MSIASALRMIRTSLFGARPIISGDRLVGAERALAYYNDIEYQYTDLTQAYLPYYDVSSDWEIRPKTCYNMTAGVADILASMYHEPVRRTWDGKKRSKLSESAFSTIVGFDTFMALVDLYTFISGTCLVRPYVEVVNGKKRITFALFSSNQVEIVQDERDPLLAQTVTLTWNTGDSQRPSIVKQEWTNDGFTEYVNDTRSDEGDNHIGRVPFVVFRDKPTARDFFIKPAIDLVLSNLGLNKLMTDLNDTVGWQTAGTLVLKGAEKGYVPKLGPGRYIKLGSGADANAFFINPNADIASCISAIDQNLKMFLSSRRIPESAIMAQQMGESGVSLVAQAASLADYRKRRINLFRPKELELIQMALEIAALEGIPCDPEVLPKIEYTELHEPFSAEDQAEWEWRFRHRVSTPVDFIVSTNPGMTADEALKRYLDNIAFFEKYGGAPEPEEPPEPPEEEENPKEGEGEGEEVEEEE